MKKMPLVKLSHRQMRSAYAVLTELVRLFAAFFHAALLFTDLGHRINGPSLQGLFLHLFALLIRFFFEFFEDAFFFSPPHFHAVHVHVVAR